MSDAEDSCARATREVASRLLADVACREGAGTFFRLLARENIPAAPIKGIVVGPALYDDPLERPFGDVDVLVARRDVGRIVALAMREGHQLVYDSKQLGAVNVIVPPGIPIDVRSSLGPPFFAGESAAVVLGRAERTRDLAVCDGPILALLPFDHTLVLVVDALLDKLDLRRTQRLSDLSRALDVWVSDVRAFARHAHRAGLATASSLVFSWMRAETGSTAAARVVAALEPLPTASALVASVLAQRILPSAPHGLAARVGVRFVADLPSRGAASLAASIAGTAIFLVRNRGGSPWRDQLWTGAMNERPPGGNGSE